MASTYPGAVDSLGRPDSTDPLSDGHAALHNATSDAVEAVQTELGVNPSGSEATVAARLTAAESATSAAQATATAAVPKATYDAHTVLAATTDNTPAAVTVAEQTIVGRKTGGNITALTAAETKTLLGLGTAAVVDVPPSGDATSGQVVKGSDSRLSDARTPTAHKTSHQSGGGDELTLAQAQITNLTSDLSAKAPLASPTFTGTPAAPTAAVDTNTTQIATTAFTVAQIADDAVLKSVADAAGDLVVGSAADTFGKLALGTDNYTLTVNTAGSGVAKVGWEDPTANPLTVTAMALKVNTATVGNLLTANQAGFEDNATTGWAKTGTGSFAASNTYAKSGTYSAAYTAGSYISSDPARTAVTAGKTYTATISYYSPSYTGPITFRAYWATAGNADISYIDGSTTAATTGAWQTLRATGVAPATATSVYFYVSGITAGQTIYVDEAGLWEGAGGQWALPGTPITNLGFYTDESVGRRLFQWDANNARWQMTYGDTGWRDVSADLINSYTGTLYLRRIGNVIHFVGNITRATSNGALNIPTGFKPTQDSTRYPQFVSRSGTTGTLTSVIVDAQLYIYGADSNIYPVSGSYIAGEDWPTTLPGTASGSIPA